jgi:hypothetical protein
MKDQKASGYFESDYLERGYPPPAFSFAVTIGNGKAIDDTAFSEVSGIGTEIETEPVVEGGENRFVHQLPKQIKPLAQWCKKTLEGDFMTMIELQIVIVKLTGANGQVLRVWQFNDAYPVKWSVDPFGSSKNEVAVEKISLAYSYSQRKA